MVGEHPQFKRKGNDIYIKASVSAVDATIGTTISVPTVDGDVDLRIPEGTQPNQVFRMKGKGVKTKNGTGDELVEVKVEIPRKVSKKERELYEKIKKEATAGPFEKFKNVFKGE